MIATGDADSLQEVMGSGVDTKLTITADGKLTMFGTQTDLAIDKDGAKADVGGISLTLKTYDAYLVLDMSGIAGEEYFLLYSK